MSKHINSMRGFLFLLLVFFVSLLTFPVAISAENAVFQAEQDRIAMVEKTMQSVIAVFPGSEDGPLGGGSGVIISPDGFALTNFHVVQPCGEAMKCGLPDGKIYDAVVVGLDPAGDIALIKLLGRDDFPAAIMGDSDKVRIGDAAFVMGNPFMLAIDFKPCISYGVISGTYRYQYPAGTFLEYTDCLQTDAAVNPGNSGGPIFNDSGELIGIIGRCSFEKRGRVNVGIGYAVSVNQTKNFLGVLKSGRIVDHASAGFLVSTNESGKVIIDDLSMMSEAYRWGLRWDDEVIRFANRTIDSANTFKNVLGIYPKGWRVPLSVRTPDGKRHEISIRLGGLHGEAELIDMTEKMLEPPIPPERPGGGEGKDGQKPLDLPFKIPALEAKIKEAKLPDAIKPYYEKKRGFANYHFNRIEQARVLDAWRKTFNKEGLENKTWNISGTISGHTDTYEFNIDEEGIVYELPTDKGLWLTDPSKQVDSLHSNPGYHYVAPRGSGGLFAGLYLWRVLATHTNNDIGNVSYAGTAPIRGELDRPYDVLDVYWEKIFAKFYFDPDDGRLVLIEFFADLGDDFPGEIYFNKYHKVDETLVPSEIEVRFGPVYFGTFDIASYKPLAEKLEGEPIAERKIGPVDKNPVNPATVPEFLANPREVIAESMKKVVKIYGIGGLSGLHAYQAGCIISQDGLILTILGNTILEADPLTVVLENGRKFEAKIFAADPKMELAILKIEAAGLPYFELPAAAGMTQATDDNADDYGFDSSIKPGDPVLAISNPFNIATGNEQLSVQQMVIAARTNLKARRGMFATTYRGPVYVLDRTTNNPGGRGGALVDRETGAFIGILGKELRNAENNTWFNFALPREQIRTAIRNMLDPRNTDKPIVLISDEAMRREMEIIPADTERILRKWGILLVTNVGSRTPPFVDTVRPGSPAEDRGMRPDDLIVMVNNRLAASRNSVEQQILAAEKGKPITLTIERDMELIDIAFPNE